MTSLALFAALAGPPLFVVLSDRLFGESPGLGVEVVLQLLYCGLAAFVVWVVIARERLPLRSIGLRRPGWSTVAFGVLFWLIAAFVLPVLTAPLVDALGSEGVDAGLRKLSAFPIWFRVLVGATGGIVEELLYRGYAIERLATITGRTWIAATIATIAFGLAHIPGWGLGFALAADLPFGVLMTVLYLWRRDLLANMCAHSTALVVSMLTGVP